MTLGTLVLLLAACGSGPSSNGAVAVQDPRIVIDPAAPRASAPAPGAASGTGAGSGVQPAGGGASSKAQGATPVAGPTALPGVGAAPGDYPEILSSSSNAPGAKAMPPHPGTLRVSPAQEVTSGATQTEQSFDENGNGVVFATLILPTRQIDLTSVASENSSQGCALTLDFSPPIEAVPATLATGTTWGGPVHTTNLNGTYSGSVGAGGTDTVGGTAVTIWKLRLALQLKGTVCGFAGSADITVDEDWVPSISLPSTIDTTSDIAIAFGTFHVTSSVQLQRLTPS